jgi:class 3 adenylate cyclase
VHTAVLKQVITELTREGCFVERLAHDPAVVTFRSPDGSRLALAADDRAFRLAKVLDGPQRFGSVSRHGTLREAIRAAIAA